MKVLSGIFAFLILIVILCFALSNQQNVDVGFWPFDRKWSLGLYLVGLAPLAFGLIFGGLWGWVGSVPHRLKIRRLHKEVGDLHAKIGQLQSLAGEPSTLTPHRRRFWKVRS